MSLCPEYDTFADLYDHVTPYRERPDVAFYAALASEAGGPVLELGCGTGRVLIPCARAGATMIGADASAGMLEVCRKKLEAEPPEVRARVEIVAADMRAFDLDRRVALVTMPFRGFQHLLTVDDQRRALASLRRHLLPGGRLVFDVFNPSLPMLGDDRWLLRPSPRPTAGASSAGCASRVGTTSARCRRSKSNTRSRTPTGGSSTRRRGPGSGIRSATRSSTSSCARGSRWKRSTPTSSGVHTGRSTRAT